MNKEKYWIKVFKKIVNNREFSLDFTDRPITFITGPNGYGKSTILKDILKCNVGSYLYDSLTELGRIKLMKEDIPDSYMTLSLKDETLLGSLLGYNRKVLCLELSDGELQLELLYRFLVSHKNTIVLVDTPEIFLHMSEQIRFYNNLVRIQEYTGSQYIIATQSPIIFNSNWSLAIDLFDNAAEIG